MKRNCLDNLTLSVFLFLCNLFRTIYPTTSFQVTKSGFVIAVNKRMEEQRRLPTSPKEFAVAYSNGTAIALSSMVPH